MPAVLEPLLILQSLPILQSLLVLEELRIWGPFGSGDTGDPSRSAPCACLTPSLPSGALGLDGAALLTSTPHSSSLGASLGKF
ncbi:hypothetical protein GMORB2_0212 [Geosmithia morbida]|uniref:Secreted protein n=1 Tax=Geosmithia morbida TaxID=1094350 RepID=A0A9P4Z2U5_9HYPO|nr:uncharacterized protein GMORB2_0212 [Geosmithia morbida]KAF4126476.1 hypothetical protein GMORB2_0212 [Geosmithia morbida]